MNIDELGVRRPVEGIMPRASFFLKVSPSGKRAKFAQGMVSYGIPQLFEKRANSFRIQVDVDPIPLGHFAIVIKRDPSA